MSGYQPTGHFTQNRRLQYCEVQYGIVPTASPVFTSAGEIESVSETTEIALKRYRSLGSEDVYRHLASGQMYSFEISYQPISSALIKYGTQLQSGGMEPQPHWRPAMETVKKRFPELYAKNAKQLADRILAAARQQKWQ